MTTWTDDTLERSLTAALAAMPAGQGAMRLDDHVGRAITAEIARRARPRWQVLRTGRRTLALGLLVGTATLTAAAGGSTLLDRMMGNGEGSRTAWALSERLGLHATVDGDEVTLERAYLDANELMYGISTKGGLDPSSEVWVDGRTPDEWGVRWAGSGLDTANGASAVINRVSAPPHAKGVQEVVVQVWRRGDPPIDDPSEERPGRFAFELPNHGGGRLAGAVTDTAHGITATLDRLVVTPVSMEGHMSFDLGDRPDPGLSGWSSTEMELLHDGERIDAGIGLTDDGSGGFNVTTGVEDWSGDWTVRVAGLTRVAELRSGDDPTKSLEPGMETIHGPWVFHFTLAR